MPDLRCGLWQHSFFETKSVDFDFKKGGRSGLCEEITLPAFRNGLCSVPVLCTEMFYSVDSAAVLTISNTYVVAFRVSVPQMGYTLSLHSAALSFTQAREGALMRDLLNSQSTRLVESCLDKNHTEYLYQLASNRTTSCKAYLCCPRGIWWDCRWVRMRWHS